MSIKKISNHILFFTILAFSQISLGQQFFGAEWTFTNGQITGATESRGEYVDEYDIKRKWLDLLTESCHECLVEGNTVTNKETGFWFQISTDPMVLELSAKPMTIKDIKKNKDFMQKAVWDTAKKAGVKPHFRIGGGHLHMDLKGHFNGDRLLFRNFIVDLMNNPELFMGGFSLDYLNAPPLAIQGKRAQKKFKKLLEKFDSTDMSIDEFKYKITNIYDSAKHPVWDYGSTKYQSLNLDHSNTLEIRGFRPQVNSDHVLTTAKIFTGRIKKLKKRKTPLKYNKKNYTDKVSFTVRHNREGEIHTYKTDVEPQNVLKQTIKYIYSSGVSAEDYVPFLTKELAKKFGGKETLKAAALKLIEEIKNNNSSKTQAFSCKKLI